MDNDKYSVVTTKCLSYVERLLPELKGQSINVINKVNFEPGQKYLTYTSPTRVADFSVDNQLEITGCPLEYESMVEEDLNETVKCFKQMWKADEELYSKFDKYEASHILSKTLENSTKNTPTFVMCNSNGFSKKLMIGSYIDQKDYFSTVNIEDSNLIGISQMDSILGVEMGAILKKYKNESKQINITSSCEYEVFGAKSDYLLADENFAKNFAGSLSIISKWSEPTFKPCEKSAEHTLFLETTANFKESLLDSLWNQQILLHNYLNILESNQTQMDTSINSKYTYKPLNFPENFKTPYHKDHNELMQQITALLQEKDFKVISLANSPMDLINNDAMENQIELKQAVKELCNRPNLDFTDNFWKILRGFVNYKSIMDVIFKALDQVYNPQINTTNTTLFGKILQTSDKSRFKFAPQQPLEFLIDMGIEKLVGDYMYLLRITNLTDAQEIKRKLNVPQKEFSISLCRKKLLLMVQINICLEFALLAEAHLDYSKDNLRRLFNYAFGKYCYEESPVTSFNDVTSFNVYNLTVSVPNEIVKNEISCIPLLYRLEISVSSRYRIKRFIKFFSKHNLFPPSVCPENEIDYTDENNQEGVFHVITCKLAGILSFKNWFNQSY